MSYVTSETTPVGWPTSVEACGVTEAQRRPTSDQEPDGPHVGSSAVVSRCRVILSRSVPGRVGLADGDDVGGGQLGVGVVLAAADAGRRPDVLCGLEFRGRGVAGGQERIAGRGNELAWPLGRLVFPLVANGVSAHAWIVKNCTPTPPPQTLGGADRAATPWRPWCSGPTTPRTCPGTAPAACSSAPCPSRCAATHRR